MDPFETERDRQRSREADEARRRFTQMAETLAENTGNPVNYNWVEQQMLKWLKQWDHDHPVSRRPHPNFDPGW